MLTGVPRHATEEQILAHFTAFCLEHRCSNGPHQVKAVPSAGLAYVIFGSDRDAQAVLDVN